MNKGPLSHTGPLFLGAKEKADPPAVALYGAPYDGTASFRPGARFGPDAIRRASDVLETYSPAQRRDLEDQTFCDLGDLKLPLGAPEPIVELVRQTTEELLQKGHKPLLLGGEHSISTGAVMAVAQFYPDVLLIQFDAHADLRAEYLGSPHNHACTMRRCLDHLKNNHLLQVGIRSGTRDEFEEMHAAERLIGPNVGEFENAIAHFKDVPIYLTVDLDIFDPSLLPGTGTPEPGGITWNQFAELFSVIPHHRIVAADVVELAPQLDPSGSSAIVAAKVVRELLLALR